MIIICQSNDFLKYYPKNSNAEFKSNLFRDKHIGEGATVALTEIFIPPVSKSYIAFVHTNLISSYQAGETCASVLRCIHINDSGKYQHIQFSKPIYFKLKCNQLSDFQISIRDEKGDLISFSDKSQTIAVLHFK